jgi:hypothetical protein
MLSVQDNVATVLTGAEAGAQITVETGTVVCLDDVPPGHKVALVTIARGAKIVKFGVSIGAATREIVPGEHVHVHNVASDYTLTRQARA